MTAKISWPEGKDFAFTIFDDTDWSTLANAPEIYKFLEQLGMRTTKSVWPIKGEMVPTVGGETCEDLAYSNWVKSLQNKGFEIGLHNVTYHSSERADIARGMEAYRRLFGASPSIHVNHAGCDEGMYWGDARFSGINKTIYNLLTGSKNKGKFQGHQEDSRYFWGDICQQEIKYVRDFCFRDINTMKACPYFPYHDSQRPFVNYWFASSEGASVETFCDTISEKNQDRLERESGACIMYTHFAKRFNESGKLNSRFVELMQRLSRKNGWFVPVSELLNYMLSFKEKHDITPFQRYKLETSWLIDRALKEVGQRYAR